MRTISLAMVLFAVAAPAFADEADLHYQKGLAAKKVGKLDEAAEEMLLALKLRPGYGAVEFSLGGVYNKRQQFDLAVKHLEEAVRLLPKNGEVYALLGVVYYKVKREDDAVKTLEKACELKPDEA